MSRIELAKIPALTLYKDEYTAARRTDPIPQLVCHGKPCKLYQPEVVRCVNIGGTGTEVDWKCEADLPESLRFGKLEVSCEGWSKPGDPYVLKDSCSLDYRLVQVPGALRSTDSPLFMSRGYDWPKLAFYILWFGFLIFILYKFLSSCLGGGSSPRPTRSTNNTRPSGGSGWFPGHHPDDPQGPPPPYTKFSSNPQTGWRPGFWTGAAMGGLANHLWNRRTTEPVRTSPYDWEQVNRQPRSSIFNTSPSSGFGSGYRSQPTNVDRGEGPSNLGSIRRSTGFGGSRTR
ncbi:hypothetical protein CVT24_013022 [Panaeolus cyanescens]|uniref:Store-operated calcium entry-associated regulatory factor n=1 Tax=Panaeolus cyanescens TaxID=181874 RepID=A0A409WAA9_9AGAR|nr:hypothetical protein CVT24_013022 [Panaeolus cyanescens]